MVDISVAVPVYNVEDYVAECIESVLANKQIEVEILCINDGSTDSSLKVVEELAAKHDCIKVVSQENSGLSATRNKAIRMATGKYLYFLDSDDKIGKNALKKMFDCLEKENLDVLYFSGESFYETEELAEQHRNYDTIYLRTGSYDSFCSGLELMRKLREQRDYAVSACVQIVRREFLLEHGIFFYEGIIHEDNLFTFQVLVNAQRANCVNNVYFYRRVRESSIMTTKVTHKNLYGYFVSFKEMLDYICGREIRPEEESTVSGVIRNTKYHVRRCFNLVNKEERERFYEQVDIADRLFFKSVVMPEIELERRNRSQAGELREIQTSFSYRAGKVVTWPLRKTKTLVEKIKRGIRVKVSVIIPVYNAEKYIGECLDSLRRQTLKNIEIICVDDGSKDGTLEILQKYAAEDKRIKVFCQENQYAGAARNFGMDNASGRYMLFLDADDFFDENLLEKTYREAERCQAEVVLFGGQSYDDKSKEIKPMPWLLNTSVLPKEVPFSCRETGGMLLSAFSPAPWTKLFRSDLIRRNRLRFQALQNSNDVFFVFCATCLASKITYLDEKFVYYRRGSGSSLQSTKKKQPLCFLEAYNSAYKLLNNEGIYQDVKKGFRNTVISGCLYNYESYTGEKEKEILLKAFLSDKFTEMDLLGGEESEYISPKNYRRLKELIENYQRKNV